MSLPAGIAAEAALTQQSASLSILKQAAQSDRAIADILEQTLTVQPSSRGNTVNIKA